MTTEIDKTMRQPGWTGFGGSGVSVNAQAADCGDGECWLAIAQDHDQIALSVWAGDAIPRRHLAMWMPVSTARLLVDKLIEMADGIEPRATGPSNTYKFKGVHGTFVGLEEYEAK